MSMSEYAFRAYCDICNEPSEWFDSDTKARNWREDHFETDHGDNPMVKQNCRLQRRAVSDL